MHTKSPTWSIQGMNDIKLIAYRFQHPLIHLAYTNTFDWQDMVDEEDQMIRQHRSTSFAIFLSKMLTMFLH
jgi:hypothetical protein